MIDEERVREMYHMAVYDERKEKQFRQMGQYYMWDYVGKEVVKSFFSGTICFVLLAVLWAVSDLSALLSFLNRIEWKELVVGILICYGVFLAIYLIVTVMVYCLRYVHGRKELRKYVDHFKEVRKMYRQEGRKGTV